MSGYPQQGYGQYPPSHGGPPPQQQSYGGPQHQNYAPQVYPPPQGQQGYGPPAGFSGHPQSSQYGAAQPPYSQQQGFNQQQGFGQHQVPPSNNSYYGGGPPMGPPGGANVGTPGWPSPGYDLNQRPQIDMSREADAIRSAMKGFGTDERSLIANMSRLDPVQANAVRETFNQRHRRDLINDLNSETSGYFRDGLVAIARGPLQEDVFLLNKAISGLGTKEAMLNDVVLGRSNADLSAIKSAYHQTYRRSLDNDVKGDLSMKTERLFTMVLAARRTEESAPVLPHETQRDVEDLYRSTEGSKGSADQITVCSILAMRSDGQIRAIAQGYKDRYHRPLDEVLRKAFSGHMEDALLFIFNSATDKAKHDASLLEDTMKGMGTKDDLLVSRVVRMHWNRERMQQAKAAYRHFYKQDLTRRIEGETKGDYERLMVAMVNVV